MAIEFVKGNKGAMVLKHGSTDQSSVKGLNKIGLPEMMRNVVKVEEFGADFAVSFTLGGEYGTIPFSGNLVVGDTKGQDQLREYMRANTSFSDARIYLNEDDLDFIAPDEAYCTANSLNDPGFQVSKITPGEIDRNGVVAYAGELVLNGPVAYFTAHDESTTLSFASSTADNSINDSASGFLTAGFAAGQTVIIEGSTVSGNNGQAIVSTAAAGKLVLTGITLATAAAGTTITLHGGKR